MTITETFDKLQMSESFDVPAGCTDKTIWEQESIPVGCVLPACQLYMLQPPDVSTRGQVGPSVNKFEQVSSYGHQVSLAMGQDEARGPHV